MFTGIAVLSIVLSSLFLVYWFIPGRVLWTRDGIVTAVQHQSDSNSRTNWNVLVYIYQRTNNGYLENTDSVALNGLGTQGHGNYCWNNGSGGCLNAPLSFSIGQTLAIEALNDGDFVISTR